MINIRYSRIVILFTVICITFSYVRKFNAELYSLYSVLEKSIIFFAIVLILLKFSRITYASRKALLCFIAYILIASLVSLLNGFGLKVIAYQSFHDAKFILLFLALTLAFNGAVTVQSKVVSAFIGSVIFLCFIDVFFRIVMPGTYDSLYFNGAHKQTGDGSLTDLVRHSGIFWHPSQLAFFCISAIYVLLVIDISKRYMVLGIFSLLALLLLSHQRFELLSMLVSFLVFFLFRQKDGLLRNCVVLANATCLLIITFISVGLLGNSDQILTIPRFVYFNKASEFILESNFLGSGWGTIGSHAAADITYAYQTIEWQGYWWIKLGLFYYDTFWPHVIGETGILGVALLLSMIHFTAKSLMSNLAVSYLLFFTLSGVMSSNLQSMFYLLIFISTLLIIETKSNQVGYNVSHSGYSIN